MRQNLGRLVLFLGLVSTLWVVFPTQIRAQGALSISNITDNRSQYPPNNQIPKYAKFEISFQIQNTVAQNLNFSYTPPNPTPYPGAENYPYDQGITVDAQFLPPGQTVWINQPAFYYQDFLDETHTTQWGSDWYYPTNNFSWKVRYAPNQIGTWQYRLTATDASGTTTSATQNFTVSNSSSHGFVKVASGDRRYFEFDDGTYFPALGYNMNYDHIGWINPEYDNPNNSGDNPDHFRAMGSNGIQLVRIWLSQWSIFGSHWSPWRDAASNDNDPPWTWLLYDPGTNPSTEFSFQISSNPARCFTYGLNTPHPAVKPNTNYRIRVSYKTFDLSGPANSGFVVKLTNVTENCNSPSTGTKITPVISTNTNSWQILESNFTTSANQYFLDFIALVLENVTAGSAEVRYMWIEENLGNNQYGPNVLPKPFMDHHRYFDQRNSFGFDKVVDQASANNVYLRPVTLDWREDILSSFGWDGLHTDSGNPAYLYGSTDRSLTRSRWLEQQWWRYLQARWGYSTAIQSWEFVNEGTPGTEHAVAADIMGQYFHQFTPKHLSATSVWSGTTSSWNLNNYPGIDFGDVHCYIRLAGSACIPLPDFYDASQATIDASNQWGSTNPARWPVIRGETGFVDNDNLTPNLNLRNDTNGVWLHNFLWAGLNSNSLIEAYWFENWHIYDCPGGGNCGPTLPFDHRAKFKPLVDFLSNVPLNQGGYGDSGATASDTNVRVVGQKNTSRNLAHLWVQDKRHTWCAAIGNVSGCTQPNWNDATSNLTGTVTLGGFTTTSPLTIEWWQFNHTGTLTKTTTSQAPSAGQLTFNLASLPSTVTDVAIKIGDYTSPTPPTPSPSPQPVTDLDGDNDTDLRDLLQFLGFFGGTGQGDFNNSGRVDVFDFSLLVANFGR